VRTPIAIIAAALSIRDSRRSGEGEGRHSRSLIAEVVE
jgi:hypothetical protein